MNRILFSVISGMLLAYPSLLFLRPDMPSLDESIANLILVGDADYRCTTGANTKACPYGGTAPGASVGTCANATTSPNCSSYKCYSCSVNANYYYCTSHLELQCTPNSAGTTCGKVANPGCKWVSNVGCKCKAYPASYSADNCPDSNCS